MDRRKQVTDEILERAWLYRDPASFREGVMEALRVLMALDSSVVPDRKQPDPRIDSTCPECLIPFDEVDQDDAEDVSCPRCGARRPDPLEEVVWAELRAMELGWPGAVSA